MFILVHNTLSSPPTPPSLLTLPLQTMQVKFARNGKIVDDEVRSSFSPPPTLADLSEEQRLIISSCKNLAVQGITKKLKVMHLKSIRAAFRVASPEDNEWEPLTSPFPFVNMWMTRAPPRAGERSVAIGKATAVIDCSALEAAGESSEASASRAATSSGQARRRANAL